MTDATQDELEQFEMSGFFVRRDVFSASELQQIREAAEHAHGRVLEEASGEETPEIEQVDNQRYQKLLGSSVKWEWDRELRAVRSMEPVYHLDSRLEALIDDPRLWGPCRSVLGTDGLSLFTDKLNVKRPGGAPFPWHQEAPYWAFGAVEANRIVSAFVYLDEGTRENGCFWVIPGSHRHGTLEGLKNRGVLGALYTDVSDLGEGVPLAVPAGTVVYLHAEIVHGSPSNRTQTDRRIYIVAYQPPGSHRQHVESVRDIIGS
ncbi:MAG: phytanoyl-CoA dioxygenase family protein [Myxococcota bacterium]